jgi:acyl-CoA thioesterase-1
MWLQTMWQKIPTLALAALIPALSATAAPAAPVPAPAAPPPPVVVFLGDSLTAGLGLAEEQAYPALLARQLRAEGKQARVINAGVSGDTTAGGLSRLGWLLNQHPALVVVALGGNDGLRGLPVAEVEGNLRQIIRRSQAAGAGVLLLGMRIPPNYGPYADQFTAVYPKLAKELGVPLVPFLLKDVGGIRALNQADGIHPTAKGQEIVAKNVLPYLEKALEGKKRGKAAVGK